MWQNNNYGNNAPYQNDFNPDDLIPSPFVTGGLPGQPLLLQNQPNFAPFQDSNSNYNTFQPEVGLFNDTAFMQNNHNLNQGPQYSPKLNMGQPPATPSVPATKLSDRAAELRAQLVKGREGRASSSTPPVAMSGSSVNQGGPPEGSNLRSSSKTPHVMVENSERELNVDDLISQYSAPPKPAANTNVKEEEQPNNASSTSNVPRSTVPITQPAKSLAPPAGSPAVGKSGKDGETNRDDASSKLESRHASKGSMSEGEISDEPASKGPLPPTGSKQAATMKTIDTGEQANIRAADESVKTSQGRGLKEESPHRRAAPPSQPKADSSNFRDDRRDDRISRSDNRIYQSDFRNHQNECKPYPEQESRHYERRDFERRDVRDRNDSYRRPDNNHTREEVAKPAEKAKLPLNEFLASNEDLRMWLDITGYNNETYREKILKGRRTIEALEAQKAKVLAEMNAGGALGTMMISPTEPNKADGQTQSLARSTQPTPRETQRDRVVSNKRPRSPQEDLNPGKVARIEEWARTARGKEEEDINRGSRPNYETYRPSDRRNSREVPRRINEYEGGRGRRRSVSRERSPLRRPFDANRFGVRRRSFDSGSESFYDRDEYPDRRGQEGRGGFRGFDSGFRGRGRGRGRGDSNGGGYQDSKFDSPFGTRIANGKPFKDPKGFNKGRKGDTRYFIVKSFNEENVLKCIADGIWTTQLQNGEIFKEAFQTCRNVILVFSINKSRAFQGYARMESLPGSIPIPDWQKAINWESAGAFKVRWLVICATRFHRIGHLKNALNDNQAVLIGKDGQEIEENCGAGLCELIDEEVDNALTEGWRYPADDRAPWEDM